MEYLCIILIFAFPISLALLCKGKTTMEDMQDYISQQPPQDMPKLYEFGSARERYLHRNDADRERRRKNQWPL